jgi:asparagine synthase (glutamine-hydrolysing)
VSKPYHFVGYWGIGSQQNLPGTLADVLKVAESEETPQCLQWETQRECWGIAYIGATAIPSLSANGEGIVASIAASGLPDVSDAWVKIENHCLILGRESFGRVPLYWMQRGQVIWFASRSQLLLPLIKTPQVNLAGLYGYSCFSYVPTPLTPVEGIFALSAATEQTWLRSQNHLTSTSRTLHKWHSAPVTTSDEAEATTHLQTLLKNAVHRQLEHLPSEPVGVFLSGGLDSSTVAALLVQAGVKVRAYTLDFGAAGVSELHYAEQVAQYLQIPLVKVAATPRRIKQALTATATALDLPFGDGVTVPLYLLCEAASQETAVIFNGENGDQLFAGWTNKPLIAAGIYNRLHPEGREDFTQQYLRTFHRLYGYEGKVFQPAVLGKIRQLDPQVWLHDALDPTFCDRLFDRFRRATLMLKGAQNIQPRATNLARAQGLMVRSPFCDLPLTQWAFQLPGELYLKNSCEKYILKRAVESWLPPEIVWREKRGMGVPLTEWCLNQLWSEVGRWLNPGILDAEGRWQPHLVWQLLKGELGVQLRGRRIGEILWLLLMWQVWRTQVLGETASGATWWHPFWLSPQLWQWYWRSQNKA